MPDDAGAEIKTGSAGLTEALAAVFEDAFAASEGAEEGARIAALFRALCATTPRADMQVFSSWQNGQARAAIGFTRMRYGACGGAEEWPDGSPDGTDVWLLSPVAVRPEAQGRGAGSRLIRHGLDALRGTGADVALTYGDPAYYGRFGFAPVTTDLIPAPQRLSLPQGWQALPLGARPLSALQGPVTCAPAWDDPALW
jgi:predicted N-acetyltransferase YhbS